MGFDPATIMAGAGAGLQLVKGFAGASAAKAGGAASEQNGLFQSYIALNNANIAEQNAAKAMQTGETNAYRTGLRERQNLGKIDASQAASGVDAKSGSSTAARQTVENAGLQGQQDVTQEAAQKAHAFDLSAWSDKAKAIMDLQGGQQAQKAANITAGGDILSGVAGAAGGLNSAMPGLAKGLTGGIGGVINGMFGPAPDAEIPQGYWEGN